MVYPRLHPSLLLLICALLFEPAFAQPASYQQQLADLKLQQQQLETDLQTTTTALQRLQQQAQPKREKYLKAQREVIAATARYDENPSDHNQSKINNAEFKLALADHKLNKFNGQLGDLKFRLEQTQQQLQAVEQTTAQRVKEEARRQWLQKVASAEASMAAEPAAVLANTAPPQPISPAELTAAATTATTPLSAVKKAPDGDSDPAPEVAAASAAAKLSMPVSATPELAIAEPNSHLEENNGISLLLDRQQISDHQQSIKQLLTASGAEKNSRNSRILTIKPVTASSDDQSTADENLRLTPIGNNIYRGETTLASGDTVFIIGFNRWRQTIPASDHNGAEHVFIFNNSVSKKPQLVYYPQALENQP